MKATSRTLPNMPSAHWSHLRLKSYAGEPGDVSDDIRAPTPGDEPADGPTELALNDAPRHSQHAT